MNKIDRYIIKKFLGTFLYTLTLLLLVVIVIDISEKIDDFMEHDLRIYTIITEYYLHFIPYFANLFSPLFIFISVVFFTSKMAENTEIIAIFNGGMSFKRFLRPFMISSIFLGALSFILGSFIIPISNKNRIDFENKYLTESKVRLNKNIHIQIKKDQYIYLESYNFQRDIGYKFSLENHKNGKLVSKLRAQYIKWNADIRKWGLNNYEIREFQEEKETFSKGLLLDSSFALQPTDFIKQKNLAQSMKLFELDKYIKQEELKGNSSTVDYKIEKHKRVAFPFAIIILTIIAVSLSSKKTKGGMGIHLGLGLLISFSYILFFQFSSTLSTNGDLTPWIAVWIPNLIYIFLGIFLLKRTQNS